MRKYFFIIITIAAALSILISTGCRRATHNGEIDGLWRVVEVEVWSEDGSQSEVSHPEDIFFGIQLELFQIDTPKPTHTGEMTFGKNNELTVRFTYHPEKSELIKYGIPSNPVTFRIETVNSKKLVLQTECSVIKCTRF